jgi:phosphoribosyl 1,2-cyclic phosphodiesterase
MNIIVLNSGSNGNAVYVESARSGAAVLLDCGISRRQIELRLKVHGRHPQNLRAVFITHEHADHVRGLPVLTKLYPLSTYLTEPTFRRMYRNRPHKGHRFMENSATVTVEDLTVQAFPKSHDASDPVFFVVTTGEKRFLYVTDLGVHDDAVAGMLSEVDAALVESNYDEDMLETGPYPPDLKDRIRADYGHLSNLQAVDLLRRHANGRLRALILGHLSENNNTPEIVRREIDLLLAERPDFHPAVHIASRYTVGDVISV